MNEAYPHYTLVKIGILRIKEGLSVEDTDDEQIEQIVQNTEKELSEGLLKYPDNSYLRSAEAELADVLAEFERVIEAMERSFAPEQ